MKPPRRKSPYYDRIAEILEKMGRSDVDPRHVEAGMRLQFSTLDHLSTTPGAATWSPRRGPATTSGAT